MTKLPFGTFIPTNRIADFLLQKKSAFHKALFLGFQ